MEASPPPTAFIPLQFMGKSLCFSRYISGARQISTVIAVISRQIYKLKYYYKVNYDSSKIQMSAQVESPVNQNFLDQSCAGEEKVVLLRQEPRCVENNQNHNKKRKRSRVHRWGYELSGPDSPPRCVVCWIITWDI